MPVDLLFDSSQSYGGRGYRDCIAWAHLRGGPIVLTRRGMRWSSGEGVTLDLLAPSTPFLADAGDDVNENSFVAMLHYRRPDGREFRKLFTGDAGEAREAQLLASGVDLRADVLKVGHRGATHRRPRSSPRSHRSSHRSPWAATIPSATPHRNARHARARRSDDLAHRPLRRGEPRRRRAASNDDAPVQPGKRYTKLRKPYAITANVFGRNGEAVAPVGCLIVLEDRLIERLGQ